MQVLIKIQNGCVIPSSNSLKLKPKIQSYKMEFTGKWIEFKELQDRKTKTKFFYVNNKQTGNAIGVIKWYGGFRQYSFFPLENIVFEKQCLRDISTFLQLLMDERKTTNPAER